MKLLFTYDIGAIGPSTSTAASPYFTLFGFQGVVSKDEVSEELGKLGYTHATGELLDLCGETIVEVLGEERQPVCAFGSATDTAVPSLHISKKGKVTQLDAVCMQRSVGWLFLAYR